VTLLKQSPPAEWIGARPSGLRIAAIMFVGTVGILIPGVQPIVLGALLTEHRITLEQLGHVASVELLIMGLTASVAAALLPPRLLRLVAAIASVGLVAGNWATPMVNGEIVTLIRAATGAAGGLLIWVTAGMIARSAAPDRWAGVYLTVQTLAQFVVATLMAATNVAAHAASSDFNILAAAGAISAVASFLLPGSYAPLPEKVGGGAKGIPSTRGFAGLAVTFLLLMFIVSIWVYYDPIAREAGLSSEVSDEAVSVSLAFQVLGGTLATVFAGRLKWFPVLIGCAVIDLATVVVLGMHPGKAVFLANAAVFGFIWLFILPFQVPMLIEADPTRRAAVLASGVGLLGASVGPTTVAMIIDPNNSRGALWMGAGSLLLCLAVASLLRFTRR
jgi:hypothetical protein